MAQNARELFTSADGKGSGLRAQATNILPGKITANLGTLLPLTPLTFNTSTGLWTTYTSGGSNGTGTILGFVWPDAIVTHASDEVLGQIMRMGRIHFADIPQTSATGGGSYTNAQLIAALVATQRALGIIIEGLPSVR